MNRLSEREKIDLIVKLDKIVHSYYETNKKRYYCYSRFFNHTLSLQLISINRIILQDKDALVMSQCGTTLSAVLEDAIKKNIISLNDNLFKYIYLNRKIARSLYTKKDLSRIYYGT